jgi:hypothetical protein
VGCDGAGSTVRRHAGVAFKGGAYRRSVLLADVDLEGDLSGDTVHGFVGPGGVLVAFAAGEHAPWRLLLVEDYGPGRAAQPAAAEGLAATTEALSGGLVRTREVAWTARIALQHRLAATFRSGRVLLAGDAAHVHSPAGAQGMNLGIQDASNLGWKLALAAREVACGTLLDTYVTERRLVARAVLALTRLAFWAETGDGLLIRRARAALAAQAVSAALRHPRLQALAVRVVGQLWVRYPCGPAAVEGRPRLRRGPGAGQRLPDLPVLADGVPRRLHHALDTPAFQLLLCGPRAHGTSSGWRGCKHATGTWSRSTGSAPSPPRRPRSATRTGPPWPGSAPATAPTTWFGPTVTSATAAPASTSTAWSAT